MMAYEESGDIYMQSFLTQAPDGVWVVRLTIWPSYQRRESSEAEALELLSSRLLRSE